MAEQPTTLPNNPEKTGTALRNNDQAYFHAGSERLRPHADVVAEREVSEAKTAAFEAYVEDGVSKLEKMLADAARIGELVKWMRASEKSPNEQSNKTKSDFTLIA